MAAKIGRGWSPAAVLAVCIGIAALEGYDIQSFGVAAPRLAPQLHLSPSQQGWAASIAMVGLVVGAFVGGWIADRIGRKPVLMVSVAVFGVFSLSTAFAGDYPVLLAARLLAGFGFGGAMPNLIAIATEISSPARRAITTSAMFCGMPAGGAVVSLIARAMGPAGDWRLLFIVGGLAPLILAPLVFLALPETRPAAPQGAQRTLLPALFREGRAAPTLLLWLANFLTLVVLYLMLNWLPSLVVAEGHTPNDGAAAALVFNLAAVAGAVLLGLVVDRAGYRWPLVGAYLALAAASWALGQAGPLVLLMTLAGATGLADVGSLFVLYSLAPRLYPPQVRAAGAGAAVGFGRLGSIVGPLLAGQLRQGGWSAGEVFGAMAPVALAAAAATLVLTQLAKLRDT